MKIEEVSSYDFEFDKSEIEVLEKAAELLSQMTSSLASLGCEEVVCDDDCGEEIIFDTDIRRTMIALRKLKSAIRIE